MPQEINQSTSQGQNHNESAAVLGFATNLSQQLMPKAPPQPQNTPTTTPQQQDEAQPEQEKVDLEANNKEIEKMMDSKLGEFKKEITSTIKEQIGGIRESIQEALSEDTKEDNG